ncbi:MAG: 3-dehydroquinate synthase [Oscillospiraceae bacterium]|nr:3-dehydroquinate synthase [Oscillospiraceae bacterium]
MNIEETGELMLDFDKIDNIPDHSGVIPVAVQDINTKEILLIAYTDRTALEESIKQRKVILRSTSRNKLWFKGAESGNTFTLHRIFVNCEQNSLVFLASPDKGGMCHTKGENGYRTGCYYRELDMDTMKLKDINAPEKKEDLSVFRCRLVNTSDESYDIMIGNGLYSALTADLKNGIAGKVSRYVIVTDSNVRPLYADRIYSEMTEAGLRTDIIEFEAGEKSKTRAVKEYVEDRMLEMGCKRDCCVIAVGGGVVSDLAGFTAGTFGRGVPFINYTTTLLAAADASIGGKTAVDTPLATNLIGLFNQPKKVYIDLDAWKTLPRRELVSGLAETIKHGCLGDRELFEYLEKNISRVFDCDSEVCRYISEHNCMVKYRVVMKDARESGLREILNLGHTVGRAAETLSDYRLTHGEAVSIGLCAEVLLGEKYGYIGSENAQRVISLCEKAGLPVKLPEYMDADELVRKLYTDKKVRNGRLRFVFQKEIGEMVCFGDNNYGKEVPEDEIAEILRSMK